MQIGWSWVFGGSYSSRRDPGPRFPRDPTTPPSASNRFGWQFEKLGLSPRPFCISSPISFSPMGSIRRVILLACLWFKQPADVVQELSSASSRMTTFHSHSSNLPTSVSRRQRVPSLRPSGSGTSRNISSSRPRPCSSLPTSLASSFHSGVC